MNKQDFISSLRKSLADMETEDINDIIYDYEEHFNIGLEAGQTEEEIALKLGNPTNIARQYRADYMVKQAEQHKSTANIVRAVLAILGLGLFNLIIVLGPFIAVAAFLISLFAVSLSMVVAGIGVFIGIILHPLLPSTIHLSGFVLGDTQMIVAGLLAAVGIITSGILLFIGTFYLSILFYNLTIKYLKLNMSIVRNKEV